MSNAEIQNSIIQKVLKVTDKELMDYLDSLLKKNDETSSYSLSHLELKLLKESMADYEKGNVLDNEEVFKRNNQCLSE